MDRAIPRWVLVWRHTAGVLVLFLAGAALVVSGGLLAQVAFDPHSPRWHGAGPAALGAGVLSPFCLGVLYLEWRVLARRDAGAARFLGGAGLLLGGGLLFSLGLGALGLLGVGRPDPEYATWPAVAWTGGVAAGAALLGGGHWLWASYVDPGAAAVSNTTAERGAAPDRPRD